jgi:hypothetical protein
MQVEMQELALFRSTNAALSFAFNFTHGQYKSSAMATMMGGPKPVGRGLGGLDGAGQSGMIRAEIDALEPRIRGQILVARFAVRAVPRRLPTCMLLGLSTECGMAAGHRRDQ